MTDNDDLKWKAESYENANNRICELLEQSLAMRAEIERLKELLKPFADQLLECNYQPYPDSEGISWGFTSRDEKAEFTLGDLRRAAEAQNGNL